MNTASNQQAASLQMFYNEDANISIRTEVINNEPWFVAKDVCNALDITWNGKTLGSIPETWQGMRNLLTPCGSYQGGGLQSLKVINESAMYKLAFRSNKPEADRFVNWIASEVLPSIRRTGSYSSNGVQTLIEEKKKLPLPKFRPGFAEWKEKVSPYISAQEIINVAYALDVTGGHVRKVYAGTSMSESVARQITSQAGANKKNGVVYPAARPVYEQLSLECGKNHEDCPLLSHLNSPLCLS